MTDQEINDFIATEVYDMVKHKVPGFPEGWYTKAMLKKGGPVYWWRLVDYHDGYDSVETFDPRNDISQAYKALLHYVESQPHGESIGVWLGMIGDVMDLEHKEICAAITDTLVQVVRVDNRQCDCIRR